MNNNISQEYIHRVGRTARGLGAEGRAVLLLRPEEKEFINYLQEAKIYLDKYELWNKYSDLAPKVKYMHMHILLHAYIILYL